jgi:hypothetical protein
VKPNGKLSAPVLNHTSRPTREGNKRPGRREVTSIDPYGEFFHT